MALGNKREILVGAAAVFLGPNGTVRPADADLNRETFVTGVTTPAAAGPADGTTSGDGSAVTDWSNVGYTQDGLEISTDPSWGEVEVDQLMDAPVLFKDGMGLSISTTFAQASLRNLMIAWGQAGSTLATTGTGATEVETLTISGGSLGEAPVERGLIAIGNAPKADGSNTYRERVYHAYNVISAEGSGHTMSRAEAVVIPVTFRALPDDATGDYGIVRDALPA